MVEMSNIRCDYVDHMGTDLTVVNAARVSFDKQSEVLELRDEKLISYLAKNGHFTPFTHSVITLRETVPIAMARQRFKHFVGFTYDEEMIDFDYNEVSRRYVDDSPEYFIPSVFRSETRG